MVTIALLRGINVGGNNILPMQDLRALLTELGLQQVRTYIQSGNVVFQNAEVASSQLSGVIARAISERYGFEPSVLVLTEEDLARAIALNPFPDAITEPKSLHLFFLASAPQDPDLSALEKARKDGEEFALIDRVFYLHAPAGIGRSKLAAGVEKSLGVPVTARNWRSVDKIMALAGEIE